MKQLQELCNSQIELETERNALQEETRKSIHEHANIHTELTNLKLINDKLRTSQIKPLGMYQAAEKQYAPASKNYEAVRLKLKEMRQKHDELL